MVMLLISFEQFIDAGAEFFQRVIWDPGTRLIGGLQHDTLLHSLTGFVFSSSYRVNCRFLWDLGIWLKVLLQRDICLHRIAIVVFSLDFRAACRLVWDPGTNCLRTSNFKEGRFVMFPLEH